MYGEQSGNVYVALIHYPVYDKNRREVATCITNLDLHDIARCAATFGVRRSYIVTPMASQREYARKLMSHWVEGEGGRYNPYRKVALEKLELASQLSDAVEEIRNKWGREPKIITTCARRGAKTISHICLRKKIIENSKEIPYIVTFGTGWGLTEKGFTEADYLLEPIMGTNEYNHLSVRCAVAITLDRLFGREADLQNSGHEEKSPLKQLE